MPIETFFSPGAWHTCTIRILVVTDDGIRGGFGPTVGFHLGQALEVLKTSACPHVVLEFTTAHRQDEATARLPAFRFDEHDLSVYSQIWLFGIHADKDAIREGDAEWNALARFMNAGGGLFSTGDHENTGQAISGALPRARSMRRWHWPDPGPNGEPAAPDQVGRGRHDTIADPDPSTPHNEGVQSDKFPQTIRPRVYKRAVGSGMVQRVMAFPHPVLCGPHGPITYLPDHMHEGLCEVPADLDRTFVLDGVEHPEYPPLSDGGGQAVPEVIACASSWDTDTTEFGVLCAFDGQRADVGRVLVDATWHHWFNINLLGLIEAADPAHACYDPAVVPKWDAIKAYFRNVPAWLADEPTQRRVRAATWLNVLGHFDVSITVKPIVADPVRYYLQLGLFAQDALRRLAPPCLALQWITEVVEWTGLRLNPWRGNPSESEAPAWLDMSAFETIAVGGAVHMLSGAVADMPGGLTDHEVAARVDAAVTKGAALAVASYCDWYIASAENARALRERANPVL